MTDRPPYPWDDEHPPKPWSDEIAWLEVPKVNDAASGDTVLADCITHCVRWKEMSAPSKTTTAHECTHGINSQIRNAAGRRMNGFYVLEGRGSALPEPEMRKRDAVPFVPKVLRGDRFQMYVVASPDWEGEPLYIWDEWVAYRNGAECGIEIAKPDGSDTVRGAVEFQGYSLAVLMATEKHDPSKLDMLLPFFRWHWDATWDTYQRGKDLFPFSGQQELATALLQSPDCASMREFCQRHQIALPKE